MKLSDLKWWHFTLATIALFLVFRVATGGSLPFVGAKTPGAPGASSAKLDRPERKPNQGTSITQVVNGPDLKVDAATPELQRLTLEATVANPGNGVGIVDHTGALVVKIAQALQGGVSEDSTAVQQIRLIVAVKGQDRTGKDVAHLSLYSLTYKASDLFKMKPTTTPAAALSLATNLVTNELTGKDALKAWCKAGDNLNQALTFCGLVTGAKD
jgi:hypothetical protein